MTPLFLDHVVLEVRDLDRSLAFYSGVLGLVPERLDLYRAGTVPFVSVRVGESLVDLFVSDHPGSGPHHFCLTFEEPLASILVHLDLHGIPYTDPGSRFGAKGQGDSVYVQDPDGHTVELRTYQNAR
ncbi:MAG: VOC family virulence protein [Sulfobacillus acidophilus]|uniref:VOC family virulence protein n=1 Tax=Sulfobacillus acidophilus TaxID=53633 RepID=A0A2T2WLA6_9FIRM|nr:MAG: VOC family virulence protein [Sulfobacillus acidophilus]